MQLRFVPVDFPNTASQLSNGACVFSKYFTFHFSRYCLPAILFTANRHSLRFATLTRYRIRQTHSKNHNITINYPSKHGKIQIQIQTFHEKAPEIRLPSQIQAAQRREVSIQEHYRPEGRPNGPGRQAASRAHRPHQTGRQHMGSRRRRRHSGLQFILLLHIVPCKARRGIDRGSRGKQEACSQGFVGQ